MDLSIFKISKYTSILSFTILSIVCAISFAAIIDIIIMHPLLCLISTPGWYVLFNIAVANERRKICIYCILNRYFKDRRNPETPPN